MELVRGEPLSARLATRGKLGTVLTLDLLEQAGRALQAAHSRGFVHRDVKPGNILLSEDGTVKLTDFGIAKAAAAAPVTGAGMVMGTAHYIAPEQARGAESGPVSDVYSLGVVGYECLAGHRPFQDESPVKVAMMHINDPVPPLSSEIPTNIRALIATALVKDPKRRYSDGGEFAAAVAAVRRGQPPPRPGTPPVLGPGTSPRPVIDPSSVGRAAGPSSDGLAVAGLAAPGLPPLPGNQSSQSGRFRTLPAPSRSGRGGLTVAFVLLAVAAVFTGVVVVRQAVSTDGGSTPPSVRTSAPQPAATAPANTAPANAPAPQVSVLVEAAGYTGRPVSTVQSELQSKGLLARARTPQGGAPATPATCTVTDVSPVGTLRKGTVVTITCVQR